MLLFLHFQKSKALLLKKKTTTHKYNEIVGLRLCYVIRAEIMAIFIGTLFNHQCVLLLKLVRHVTFVFIKNLTPFQRTQAAPWRPEPAAAR